MDYWQNIVILIGIYGILAMSLNVICGLTGLLQLGHVGFFAAGAYAAGLISIYFTVPALGWFNLLLGCAGAMVAAGVFALLIGLPCLRLRGDYLAIATLGFAEILRMSLNNIQFPGCALTGGQEFGGATGIAIGKAADFPPPWPADYANAYVIWAVVALSFVFFLNLKRSSIGRAFMCIREDEITSRAMGINVPRCKLAAFLLSAVFAGLAGALFIHNGSYGLTVKPNDFGLLKTVELLLIVVLGGLGSFTGSLLAAVILVLMPELLRFIPALHLGGAEIHVAEFRQLIYAVLLIVLIRLMPDGILGMGEWPRRQIRIAKS